MAIAVVDDDDDVRDAVRAILEEEGYQTIGAANGEEALKLLEQGEERPTLILLDLMMPGMDGWEFLARIDEQRDLHAIPVALMSAHPSVIKAFGAARGSDVSKALLLPKPLNVLRLLSLVERICRNPKLPS
jgi:CheY-like chemotaxis protein